MLKGFDTPIRIFQNLLRVQHVRPFTIKADLKGLEFDTLGISIYIQLDLLFIPNRNLVFTSVALPRET